MVPPTFPEWKSIRSTGSKYIVAFDLDEDGERIGITGTESWTQLFDLKEDPLERVDLHEDEPEAARTLHELMLERFAAITAAGAHDGSTLQMSDDMVERLKALGYVE